MKNNLRINLKWIIIFSAVCAVCIAVWICGVRMTSRDKKAEIIQNGKVIRVIDLDKAETPYEFDVEASNGGSNTIRVEKGRIAVIKSDCPDKICVNEGFTSSSAVPIVCLPHKLSVVIKNDNDSDIDAVSGLN